MRTKVSVRLTDLQKSILKYVCESEQGQNVISVQHGLGKKDHVTIHQAVRTLEKNLLVKRVRDHTKKNALEITLTDLGVAVAVVHAGASAEAFFYNNRTRISKSDSPFVNIVSKIDDREQRDIVWFYLFRYLLEHGYYERAMKLPISVINEVARDVALDQRTNPETFEKVLPRLNDAEKVEAKRQIVIHKEKLLKLLESMEQKLKSA